MDFILTDKFLFLLISRYIGPPGCFAYILPAIKALIFCKKKKRHTKGVIRKWDKAEYSHPKTTDKVNRSELTR